MVLSFVTSMTVIFVFLGSIHYTNAFAFSIYVPSATEGVAARADVKHYLLLSFFMAEVLLVLSFVYSLLGVLTWVDRS